MRFTWQGSRAAHRQARGPRGVDDQAGTGDLVPREELEILNAIASVPVLADEQSARETRRHGDVRNVNSVGLTDVANRAA